MAKVISEYTIEAPVVGNEPKMVEIKMTRTMQDASGNDVEVVDFTETKQVDEAISQAESRKASLEAKLVDVEAELVEYKKIKDA